MLTGRLLSIDPSLTCSGWALFSLEEERLIGVGKIHGQNAKIPLAVRLTTWQTRIRELLESLQLQKQDILLCEAPTTMRDPSAALKVENVRGLFEAVARERDVQVPGRLNPRTIHSELMGLRGKQLARNIVKESAIRTVQNLFSHSLTSLGFPIDEGSLKRHQDIVDAILIGALAVSKVRHASLAGQELEQVFDTRAIRQRGRSYL